MTRDEKLRAVLDILGTDEPSPEYIRLIGLYLDMAEREILAWRYSYAENRPCVLPSEFDTVQLFAVIAGINTAGAENQLSHTENGVSRSFKHSDMISYIRANVTPYAGIITRDKTGDLA